MKKWLIILCILFLYGCQETEKVKVQREIIIEEPVNIEEEVPEDSLDDRTLKQFAKSSNRQMTIIEIETLHDLVAETLAKQIDLEDDLESQRGMIEEAVAHLIQTQKKQVVEQVLSEASVELTPIDFNRVMEMTSGETMYQVMLQYELVYWKRQAE